MAILYRGMKGKNATAKVKAFVDDNDETCRHSLLFQEFQKLA